MPNRGTGMIDKRPTRTVKITKDMEIDRLERQVVQLKKELEVEREKNKMFISQQRATMDFFNKRLEQAKEEEGID